MPLKPLCLSGIFCIRSVCHFVVYFFGVSFFIAIFAGEKFGKTENYIFKTKRKNMNIGDKAPEILGKDENGKEIRLSDFKGQKLVLYFYPKDNTSGCTAEACSLRDNYKELRRRGYAVVGVSVQDEKSHKKFIEKHELPFPLIADTENQLVEQFGVWAEKSMYGRKYMGTLRTTFIINEDGIVEHIFLPKQIKTKTHGEQILEAINS